MPEKSSTNDISYAFQALLVLACGLVYFYAFRLNAYLFDALQFSEGVNWVFIPSGLRFLLVLVLFQLGAIGIALASCLINYLYGTPDAHLFNIVTGFLSGFSPLVARYWAVDGLKLRTDLGGLTVQRLFKASVLFAIISATLHQLWFFWQGTTTHFVASAFAMAIGDWFGTVLVLATASLLFKLYRRALN
jgi:hypothetical protein